MSNETIADLRTHLFGALRGLADRDKPMDIERARAVSDIAQTIINSAKVELDHLRLVGGNGTGFLPAPAEADDGSTPTAHGTKTVTRLPGGTVTQHRLR